MLQRRSADGIVSSAFSLRSKSQYRDCPLAAFIVLYSHKHSFIDGYSAVCSQFFEANTMGGIKQEHGDGSQPAKASHSADQRPEEVCAAAIYTGFPL